MTAQTGQTRPLRSVQPRMQPDSATPAPIRRHPSRGLIDARTASALLTAINDCRVHEVKGSDGYHEAAQTLYKRIKKTGRWPGGVDKIIVARRIRKLVLGAGVALEESSRNLTVAAHEMQKVLSTAKTGTEAGEFDGTK
jgi:hypothetical protein